MHSQILFLAQAAPAGRVFGLDQQTLISIGIQLLNGIILAAALGFLFYKPVKEFMRKRTEQIQSSINDTDATMAKSQELIAEYDLKIKNIDKERIKILEAARIKAADEGRLILEEAKKEANEIKRRSLDTIQADKKRLQEETRLYIIEMASFMAEKYITQKIDNEIQDKVFEEALEKMEIAQW